MKEQRYNGWKNRQTWNVAMWLGYLEESALEYIKHQRNTKKPITYTSFIKYVGLQEKKTPDNIKWLENGLDLRQLTKVIQGFELIN